jgi:hypothetical protein
LSKSSLWKPIGTVAFGIALERCGGGINPEEEQKARLEVLADLAAGLRQAVGITAANKIKLVPQALFAFAEPGEQLDWAGGDPFIPNQGYVIVDFRCDALGKWEYDGYTVLFSELRVSESQQQHTAPASTENVAVPATKPTRKRRVSGAFRVAELADEILADENTRPAYAPQGWKTNLAHLIHKKMIVEDHHYEFESVTRELRKLKIKHPEEPDDPSG